MKSKDVKNISIRVDQNLANLLRTPKNTKISFSDMVTQLLEYVERRRLDDPESNLRDDFDPNRQLDRTVVLNIADGDEYIICNFCGHHIGLRDFALATCRRCNKRLSVRELVNGLFDIRKIMRSEVAN